MTAVIQVYGDSRRATGRRHGGQRGIFPQPDPSGQVEHVGIAQHLGRGVLEAELRLAAARVDGPERRAGDARALEIDPAHAVARQNLAEHPEAP